MSHAFANLLSPIKVGKLVLKNRMTASSSMPHFLQGPERYPAESIVSHFAKKAKSGASLITVRGISTSKGWTPSSAGGDIPHMPHFDLFDPQCQNYISHLADAMHFYNSKACMNLDCLAFPGYDVSSGTLASGGMQPNVVTDQKEYTLEMMEAIADSYAEQAAVLKSLGFDAVSVHMAYRHKAPGRFLSPLTNHRTDEFGGSLENRAKFPIMVCDRIKKACGQDFVVHALVSAEEPEGGLKLMDTVEFAKMAEGYIDILQVRHGVADPAHPTGFNPKAEPFVHYAEALKDAKLNMLIETIGGYQNPIVMEEIIRDGKADLIAMARSWISNVDYGEKIYQNRIDDITPCVRCNKCHVTSLTGPWVSVCTVNPQVGLEHKVERLIREPGEPKKVAVIGGGPAGMEAAIIAAQRGNSVTLFERSDRLGGQLIHADYASFKWPMRNFKNFLIYQCGKTGVDVRLNTEATPDMIRAGGYDVVLAATGAQPIILPIPGVDSGNVHAAIDVYGDHEKLGKNVVIIGGGEIGVETGIYLAQNGHEVTVIEMLDKLAPETTPIHYRSMFEEAWETQEGFHYILNARCTGITPEAVTYVDKEGVEHAVAADGVVIAAGTRARDADALAFYDTAGRFAMIGDCNGVGNVQKVMRSAYSTAATLC